MMLSDSAILRREALHPSFRVSSQDWRELLGLGVNTLVGGPSDAVAAFARSARSYVRRPIIETIADSPLIISEAGTLMLSGVEQLSSAGQQRLGRWLSDPDHARTQVITLTGSSLFALVRDHAFDSQLFYRLNTIYLEVQEA